MTKAILIAGTHSGCGKTLVSLALMAAFVRRGYSVQPYKAGPDFIDPGHHTAITGRHSHNLDGWMVSQEAVHSIFQRNISVSATGLCAKESWRREKSQPKDSATGTVHKRETAATDKPDVAVPDIAIIEGVMGLFDGASGTDDTGSTAQLAKWLGVPVILVADTRSMARSAAALIHGYTTFDPDIPFAGVLLNRVGSDNHRDLLETAISSACPDIPVLGCLPRNDELSVPSRHLGLITAEDAPHSALRVEKMAEWIDNAVDLDALLAALPDVSEMSDSADDASKDAPNHTHDNASAESLGNTVTSAYAHKTDTAIATRKIPDAGYPPATACNKIRIGIARDAAFCFYYQENIRLLEQAGAEVVFFSPLAHTQLPDMIHGLYLGGGYPELHAQQLSENTSMREAIARFAADGNPVYAECGGFMYLMQSLTTHDGDVFPMVGHFPMSCTMNNRFRALGYRQIETTTPSIIGPAGMVARGHEFHYSSIIQPEHDKPENNASEKTNIAGMAEKQTVPHQRIYTMTDRKNSPCKPEGYTLGNTLGSYVHLHFASNPEIAPAIVAKIRQQQRTTT